MTVTLLFGRWQDLLGECECDAIVTDPPYSARTPVKWALEQNP